jgi:hypothetical protein
MAKFTKEQADAIIAQSRKHMAVHRAEKFRKKQALLLQKKKMMERRAAQSPQIIRPTKPTSPPTFGLSEFNRDVWIGVLAEIKGLIRDAELKVAEARGANDALARQILGSNS